MFKRSITFSVIVLLLVICTACGGVNKNNTGEYTAAKSSKTAKVSYETTSHPGSIHIKWKVAKATSSSTDDSEQAASSASRYEIYRKDITGAVYTSDDVPFEDYDKIGSTSGEQSDFDDRKAENGHYYTYVIRGFDDADKIVCDNFKSNVTQYACAGLAKPDLINNGYGENNENTPKRLHLLVQIDGGMSADGIKVYRKADSEDEFTLIRPEKVHYEDDGYGMGSFEIEDTSIKPGNIYTYKVRTFAEESGERVESEYSDTVKMYAVNFVGQYKISGLSVDSGSSRLSLTLESDPENGKLSLRKGAAATLVVKNSKGKEKTFDLKLEHKKAIKAGEKMTLTFVCGGKLPKMDEPEGTLTIEDEGTEYDIGIIGYTTLELDLAKGTGTAFTDYDN